MLFIDQRWCAQHGIGRFATEVRRRLPELADLPLDGWPARATDALKLARCLSRQRASGLYSPGFSVPAWARCPVVVTIHDLIHVHCAAERTLLKHAYYRFVQRPVVRRSPVTLTVSEYSRQQIMEWYDVPADRVVCVGNGISESFSEDGEAIKNDRPYFLYVGNTKPHKNVTKLLQAFRSLRTTQDVSCILVTNSTKELERQIEAFGLNDAVQIIGGLSDEDLAKYYRGAVALVMPSRHEGFGLPLAEAMACGCPVIGSNRTSIPEVVGNAGRLFDPDDADDLSQAMSDVLQDEHLRNRMKQYGLKRSLAFSWDSVADRIRCAIAAHLN